MPPRSKKNKKTNKKRKSKRKNKKSRYPNINKGLTIVAKDVSPMTVLSLRNPTPYGPGQQYIACTNLVFRVSDCTGLTAVMLKYFEWFRIVGVKMTITNTGIQKVQQIVSGSENAVYPVNTPTLHELSAQNEFLIVKNREGHPYAKTISMTEFSAAKQKKGAIILRNIGYLKSKSVHLKPNTLSLNYETSVQTGYVPAYDRWVRNNDISVPHYGYTICMREASSYAETYELDFEYIVQYKSHTNDPALSIVALADPLTCPGGADSHNDTDDRFNSLIMSGPYIEMATDPVDDVPNQNGYEDLAFHDITEL